jgi:hypothetical protein
VLLAADCPWPLATRGTLCVDINGSSFKALSRCSESRLPGQAAIDTNLARRF